MFTSRQQEQIAESVDNIIANSRRDFSSYITFQVTCSSVELFAKVNGVEYTRSINFSTRDGETINTALPQQRACLTTGAQAAMCMM